MIINKEKIFDKKNIIIISILLLFLITIALIFILNSVNKQIIIDKEKERVKQYTSIEDFKTLEEVALYLNSTFENKENSKTKNIKYDIYMKLAVKPTENNISNQSFYENLIQYSAYVLEYENFSIIDNKNKVVVTVICNKTEKMISTYLINGELNYFEKINSKQNLEEIKQLENIALTIDSEDLKGIVENKWQTSTLDLGTIESTYRGYDIYFDEGIQIKKINQKVFNIIFNKKYIKKIVNGLSTNSSKDEIIKKLGNPQFERGDLIGYRSNNIYIFFFRNQISIYRNENYETNEIAKIIEEYINGAKVEDTFFKIKNIWNDYDKYVNTEENILLQYTLKGLKIEFNTSSKNGFVIFNNYVGKICGELTLEDYKNGVELPNKIYFENEDLVFKNEIERVSTMEDTTMAFNNKTYNILNISNKFKINSYEVGENIYQVRFISINEEYPNFELRDYISYGIWLNDYEFVYSIFGKGIYKFNVIKNEYTAIITGKSNYRIYGLENNTLYYDEVSINL